MSPMARYLASIAILCAGFGLIHLLRRFIFRRLVAYVARNDNTFSPKLLRSSIRALTTLLYVAVIGICLAPINIRPDIHRYLSLSLMLIGVFLCVTLSFNVISFLLDAHLKRSDGELSGARGRTVMPMAKALVIVVASVFLLDNLGFKVTSIVTGIGIVGVAMGLAGQALLADFFAHFAILLDRPFGLGDHITAGKASGTVEYIGLKSTRIRAVSGERIVLPNAWLASAVVRNFNDLPSRRFVGEFLLSHDTPADKLELIPLRIQELVEQEENATFERAHFMGSALSGLCFEVVYHVQGSDYVVFLDVNQRVQLGLLKALDGMGVKLAASLLPVDETTCM